MNNKLVAGFLTVLLMLPMPHSETEYFIFEINGYNEKPIATPK